MSQIMLLLTDDKMKLFHPMDLY